MRQKFKAKIYPVGINWCVDVPSSVSGKLKPVKGYIRIKGTINNYEFTQTLVPVKGSLYRLFVNGIMMKGGSTALGEIAVFHIEQNEEEKIETYLMPLKLEKALIKEHLVKEFDALTPFIKKEILKYLNKVKTEVTFDRNLNNLILQLKRGDKDVRIPKK